MATINSNKFVAILCIKCYQDNNEGDWEGAAVMGSNPECCGTNEGRYVSASESENSEYRQYEHLPNINSSVEEDLISPIATYSGPVRGKLIVLT